MLSVGTSLLAIADSSLDNFSCFNGEKDVFLKGLLEPTRKKNRKLTIVTDLMRLAMGGVALKVKRLY